MSTEQEIIADEARFIDFPSVTEDAAIVVEKTRKLFSLQRYSTEGRKLEVTWAPVEDFRAWAAARPGEPPTDQIGISYGAAWEIYRDAFVLPQFCEKHFATERYAQVYGPMQFGGGSARVLPEGLTAETANGPDHERDLGMALPARTVSPLPEPRPDRSIPWSVVGER